jgi:hypothetical protein
MRGCWLLLLPVLSLAQTPPSTLTGVLLEHDSSAILGQFSLRAPDSQVFRFTFDTRTTVDRAGISVNVPRLVPGETLEVVSEPVDGSLLRAARAIRVLEFLNKPRVPQPFLPITHVFATPDLTISGLVSKFSSQSLTLRARDGDHTILLRKDTRYLADGSTVDADALRPNMRVFVFAGKDLYQRVEAYRIVWGAIFDPKR